MPRLGFIRRDFEVFAIEGFSARMEKIHEHVNPKLTRLGVELTPEISRKVRAELFAHAARHPRRGADPPGETWTAWGPSARGYKRYPYLALCISGAGIHARAIVKVEAERRPEMGRRLQKQASALERAFRGSKIQGYERWNFIDAPKEIAADAVMFAALGAVLEKKNGTIDVGFGWPWREALALDIDEVLDAFGELGPLYDVLTGPL